MADHDESTPAAVEARWRGTIWIKDGEVGQGRLPGATDEQLAAADELFAKAWAAMDAQGPEPEGKTDG